MAEPDASAASGSQVVVVGGGISGSACARALAGRGVRVELLDRARNPGGRLASHTVEGRIVDVGGSYLTARDPLFVAQVQDWADRGLARQWTDTFHVTEGARLTRTVTGPMRWSAPGGLRSLVADLQAGLAVTQSCDVDYVDPGPLVDGRIVEAVVLAMPDPQAADLLAETLVPELEQVESRAWEPSLALYAGWESRAWDPAVAGVFVNDHDVLGWIADDGSRRGDGAPVLVAHATPGYAERHLDDPGAAVTGMVDALRDILSIPVPPLWAKVKRWSLARPAEGRDEPFFLGDSMVGLCGDGWHGSPRVEAAYLSGVELARAIADRLAE